MEALRKIARPLVWMMVLALCVGLLAAVPSAKAAPPGKEYMPDGPVLADPDSPIDDSPTVADSAVALQNGHHSVGHIASIEVGTRLVSILSMPASVRWLWFWLRVWS